MNKKVAIITGANRGIGQMIANSLAIDYNTVICDVSAKFEDKYGNVLYIPCDVSDKNSVKDVVNKTIEKFGRIDVLVNNAGLMLFDLFDDIKDEDIDRMYDVNVKGALFFSQEVLPVMRKQNSGYIITISSTRGITGAPHKGAYSATKFAVRGLMESIQTENKKYGIKTTSICPGAVGDDKVTKEDVAKTVKYLLSLGPKAYVKQIIIGGQL